MDGRVREVVRYPDERLKAVCDAVPDDAVATADVQQLAADLLATMRSFPGCVGIAAPQIGALVRMFAIDVTGHKRARSCAGEVVLINPEIVARSGSVSMREGCLSIPDFTGNVTRAEAIELRATDVDGASLHLHCDAYEARVVLHEHDHLDGLLFLDRVRSAKDVFPRKQYR